MKRGQSTTFVADALAEHFGVPAVDVSYAGRKDRVAVTSQWFSVRCATRSAAGPAFRAPACRVLDQHWAARKLRRADHRANAFVLTLHCAPNTDAAQRLGRLAAAPVLPNYFGPQRFSAGTVTELAQELARRTAATPWPKRRRRLSPQQSWLASVCRSFLFNEMLALQMRTQQCDANAMAATLPLLGSDRDLRPQAPQSRR